MSALTTAFAESGHGGPIPKIAPTGRFRLTSARYRRQACDNNGGCRPADPRAVSCWQCHHETVISAAPRPDNVPVPAFGPRRVCTRCGIVGANARPNWQEQPQRESLR
jgi:hypothetical protein